MVSITTPITQRVLIHYHYGIRPPKDHAYYGFRGLVVDMDPLG